MAWSEAPLRLAEEIFVIPLNDNFILYAPLAGTVLEVTSGMIPFLKRLGQMEASEHSEIMGTLRDSGILVPVSSGKKVLDTSSKVRFGYLPTSLAVLPSYNCNLRCLYCYSKAGEDCKARVSWPTVKAAIDFALTNAQRKQVKKTFLAFSGGGEPFLPANMDLIKCSVEYFRSCAETYGLRHLVSGATNGVLRSKDLEWMAASFDTLSISLDGPKDVQDRQRPFRNGSGTTERVLETLSHLDSVGFR